MLRRFIDALPAHFRWTIHNLFAHPISEIAHLVGFTQLGNRIHDATLPSNPTVDGRG